MAPKRANSVTCSQGSAGARGAPWRAAACAVLRALGLLLAAGWLLGSAASGGMRWAALNAWNGVHRHQQVRGWPPDARNQYRGPFYDALHVLTKAGVGSGTTVAVVLPDQARPGVTANPSSTYEALYRLYPAIPDLFFPAKPGGYAPLLWELSSPEKIPAIPALWAHEWVVWADPTARPRATGYTLAYTNREVRVYRALRK